MACFINLLAITHSMRIISLAPSNTEILYALECSDEIVAVTRFCDYPEEAKLKPKVGGWIDIDDKLVEKYMPDVIMTSTFVQDKIVSRFKEKGIKIFHSDPKTLEQVYESIISIGEFVDKKEKALEIVAIVEDINNYTFSMSSTISLKTSICLFIYVFRYKKKTKE